MLRTAITAAGLALAAASATAQSLPTLDWRARQSSSPAEVDFTLEWRTPDSRSIHSNTTPIEVLRGLTQAQIAAPSPVPVRFRVDRDAGALDCDGIAQHGVGAGRCAFLPNRAFASAFINAGGTATDLQLFSLTLADVGRDYVAELRKLGYRSVTAEELVDAANHGVSLTYVRAIGEAGYRPGSLAGLVRMRDHGVTADYVARLARVGTTSPDTIVRLRDHGVSADYVEALQTLGYRGIGLEQLVLLRDHGVSPSWVRELKAAGYDRFTADELVALRDRGVSSGFVTGMAAAGYRSLSVEQLSRLRDSGVGPEFVRRVNAGGRMSVEELVRLRNGG